MLRLKRNNSIIECESFSLLMGTFLIQANFCREQATHENVACAFSGDLAHLGLQVVLQADPADQVELGFQEVNVFFRIVKNALEQVA